MILIFNRQLMFLYFSCPFKVFTMSASHIFEKFIFVFLQNKNFSKSNKIVFQAR